PAEPDAGQRWSGRPGERNTSGPDTARRRLKPPSNGYQRARRPGPCILILQGDGTAIKDQRDNQAQVYGREAVKKLRRAPTKGFNNVSFLKQDAELDPLRTRTDFQVLIAELEGKAKP